MLLVSLYAPGSLIGSEAMAWMSLTKWVKELEVCWEMRSVDFLRKLESFCMVECM